MLIQTVRDGDWELVNWNPSSGVQTWVKQTVHPDGLVEQTFRYETPINDQNLSLIHDLKMDAGTGWKGDWHKVASIPAGMTFHGYLGEAMQADDWDAAKKWLNDSENRAFRTKEGNL